MNNRSLQRLGSTAIAVALMTPVVLRAANQSSTFSPVVIGAAPLDFATQIGAPLAFPGATLPTLHSFSKATYFDPAVGHDQWILIGGKTNGMHDVGGSTGFDPAAHNRSVYIIDPVARQVWGRSLNDSASGLTTDQIETIATTNAQHTQQGARLYITGGYGRRSATNDYQTFDTLTSVDLPGIAAWAKGGAGTAAAQLRQISDPLFQVTGGEMATAANGTTHLIFGQNYPTSYEPRFTGEYTQQVRSFRILDDAGGLRIDNVVYHDPQEDFRRRDLNVVPVVRLENGQTIESLRAMSGVFTPTFGQWTVPVDIDADGNAVQRGDAEATDTFRQGLNAYRSGTIGAYSARADRMHTLLLGGIGYQYFDAATGQIADDYNLPYSSDATDVVTDAAGRMTQYLLAGTYPSILSANTGAPLLLGTETEFFLADGVPTYGNGVIDLDALTGRTLVGYLFGGIAAEQPNFGPTTASNALFPVYLSPVPEPAAFAAMVGVSVVFARRRQHAVSHHPRLPGSAPDSWSRCLGWQIGRPS